MPQTTDNFSSSAPIKNVTVNERIKDAGWPVWLMLGVVAVICWSNWPSKGTVAAPIQVTPVSQKTQTTEFAPHHQQTQPLAPQIIYVGYQMPTAATAPYAPAPVNVSNIIQLGDKQLTPISSQQGQQQLNLNNSPAAPAV